MLSLRTGPMDPINPVVVLLRCLCPQKVRITDHSWYLVRILEISASRSYSFS